MGLKKTENRVKVLLVDTITALCRNTLQFNAELNVEGLIGITVDNQEIFLVNINQQLKGKDYDKEKEKEKESEKDTPRKHKRNSNDSPEGKGGKRRKDNDFVDLCDDDDGGGGGKKRKDDDVVFVRKERDGRGYGSNPTTPSRRQGGPGMQQSPRQMQQSQQQMMQRSRMQNSQSAQALRLMSRGRGSRGSGGLVPRGAPPPNAYAANAAAASAGYPSTSRGRGRGSSYSRGGMSSYPMQSTSQQQMYAQYNQQQVQQMMGDASSSYTSSSMQQQMSASTYPTQSSQYASQYNQAYMQGAQGSYMTSQGTSQSMVGMTTLSSTTGLANPSPIAATANSTTLQISNVQGAQSQSFNSTPTTTSNSDSFSYDASQNVPTVIQPISMEDDLIPDLTLSSTLDSITSPSVTSAPSTSASTNPTTSLGVSIDSTNHAPASEPSPPLQTDIPSPQEPNSLDEHLKNMIGQIKQNPEDKNNANDSDTDIEPVEKEPISIVPQTNLDSNNPTSEGATKEAVKDTAKDAASASGAPSGDTKKETPAEEVTKNASKPSTASKSGSEKPVPQEDLPTITKKRRGRPAKNSQQGSNSTSDGNTSQASTSPTASVASAESVPAAVVEPRSSLRRNAKEEKKALVLGGDSQSDEEQGLDDSDDGDWVPGSVGSSKSTEARGPPPKRSKDAGKKYRCEICGKIFAFQSQFQAHMDKHQMEDCGPTTPTTSASNDKDTDSSTSQSNSFVCQVCAETFKIACFFKKHMDLNHAGVGYPDPHQGQNCSMCYPPPPPSLTKQ